MKHKRSDKIIASGVKEHSLYIFVDEDAKTSHALAINTQANCESVWHQRYGHMNSKYLSLLNRNRMVNDLPTVQEEKGICATCLAGKQRRKPFDEGKVWRAKGTLDPVHYDLCKPMKTTTVAGARYFLLFVDDFSKKMWVFFFKKSSDVFKVAVENDTGRRVKTLCSDNGNEFTSTTFESFCKKEGIQIQFTTSYTPQ